MNIPRIGAVALLAVFLIGSFDSPAFAQGKKKKKTPTRFSVLEIPIDGQAGAISEPNQGIVTVGVRGSDEGRSSAAFARIDSDYETVLEYGFLPEPRFVEPESGDDGNGGSSVKDINNDGIMVGRASAFEDDPNYSGTDINPGRAVVWTYNGSEYAYELLPSIDLADSHANGINNFGVIVGSSDSRAVVWDPFSHEIEDLNTSLTAALGWYLKSANDINDAGLVVGHGYLLEEFRGFLLDLDSGAIMSVPLIGPADGNAAYQIDANGRVVGPAWDGTGNPNGLTPDYYRGYSWDGSGATPTVLESVTDNTSQAFGANDFGAATGVSIIPNDNIFANNRVPTLWEPDGNGGMSALNLREEIGGYTSWLLTNCNNINNDGWITAEGRKRVRGRYVWRALLVIPNQ